MLGRGRFRVRWLLALLAGALVVSVPCARPSAGGPRSAVVIALDGPIGVETARYVVRELDNARQQDAVAAVLRLDTPGGLDSAMREIIRAMLGSPVPVLAYVAPGGARAASAGTYILYAAALAAMAPGTNLGAATPVSLFGDTPLPGSTPTPATGSSDTGDKVAGPAAGTARDAMLTKIANDAAAYIRGLAVQHGRNADWAEKAVRDAVSLPYDAALDQHVIDLVATDVTDLLTQADGRNVIVHGQTVKLATRGAEIVQVEPDWHERLLARLTDPSVIYLLLLAGLFGITFELSHPGVYAPGVVGVICLLIGGYGLELLPIDYVGLALAILGLGLMTAEAFVPAFGAFVLGGVTAFTIGSLMMFDTPGARLPLVVIAFAALAAAALFGLLLSLLVRARRRPVVGGTPLLIGLQARTVSWSGGEGEVLVQGERWRARAASPLQPGQAVRIVGRDGLTLLLEPA